MEYLEVTTCITSRLAGTTMYKSLEGDVLALTKRALHIINFTDFYAHL